MRTVVVSLVLILCLAAGRRADGEWKAGWASEKITPDQPMWMAGYGGRDHPAEGALTDLWAKALVLEDGQGRRAVLLTLDLVGIDRETSERVCRAIMERHSIDRSRIALCPSHTHTGPVVSRNLTTMHYRLLGPEQQTLVDRYSESLEKKMIGVVDRAFSGLAPARVEWGSGRTTLAVNRRNNKEADVVAARDAGRLVGPLDHDVPVLAVRDAMGKLNVAVFGYACHATVLSFYQWSGDYPGFAQIELESLFPGCQAMFWAGCGGDQNPLPRRTVEMAQAYGRRLALAVSDVVTAPMEPIEDRLETAYAEIPLSFGTLPTPEQIAEQAASTDRFVASRGKMWQERLAAGETLPKSYPYPIASWRLGSQCEWVFLGGEVVVDYAVRLKAERLGQRTWVAGYSNDVMAYIPSRRVLLEGGYEGGGAMVYYGQPTIWAETCEEEIVVGVHVQLGTLPPR
ncbi:MAG: hypothetical protein FJ297_03665 [Planctomycetes bacterium]|nr:hypothetical protein [Planctomycetota bacterium]